MYDYLKGILTFVSQTKITVDVNGLGYSLNIPLSAFCKLSEINKPITCFLSLIIKEDSHCLYGFLSKKERDLFETLITISGIGPKTALSLIGHLDINHFLSAISSANVGLICKVPGIGKKTAERLIVEMRDKIKNIEKEFALPEHSTDREQNSHISDALNALIHLGYNHMQAQKALNKALEESKDDLETGKLISLALKKL